VRTAALLTGLVLLFTQGGVAGDNRQNALESIAQRLTIESRIEGRFRQEKHLAFMQNPIVAEGDFSLSRSEGLTWQVITPVSSLMQVRGREVLLDGERVQDHGIGRMMSRLMLGFMEGDLAGVTGLFDVQIENPEQEWRIQLEPKAERLKRVFDRIDLSGDSYLRQIDLHEADGNSTRISFSEVRPVP